MYIAAQVLASICSSFALKGIFDPFMSGGVTVPSVGYGQAFALEFIIGFNLMFVVTAVATDTRAVSIIYLNIILSIVKSVEYRYEKMIILGTGL